jgi:peptidoglycan hydrolase FlgJ
MTATPVNSAFYADPTALAALKRDAKAQTPEALKEAAKQFESLFTQMMLKSMRDATESFGDSMFRSDQTDFYQGMFDDQLALHLSKGKGLGLADMLIQQLRGGIMQPPVQGPEATQQSASAQPLSSFGTRQPASKEDFVRSMWPHAQEAAQALGVEPHALLAQAALETGWGRSMPLASNGANSFNLFGIKAGASWNGSTVNVPTLEFEDGVAVRRVERFRAYASPADSFRDYAALLRNNSRYEDALGAGADVATFASALQQGGYATDPDYARKIVAVADQVRALTAGPDLKSASVQPLPTDGGEG